MKIIGNGKLLAQIEEMLQNGRMFHACIVSGPRGSGKKTLAGFLAKAAVCLEKTPPCGHCEGCLKAQKEIHPDMERVKRERGEITIEQVRSLRASLYTRANEAPRKVAVIEEADKMNRSAQNALLTVLEEPPSDVLLILIAENEEELLPTIRSRCVKFRMAPLQNEEIINELKSRDPSMTTAAAKHAAARSGGYLGRALELSTGSVAEGYAEKMAAAMAKGDKKAIICAVLPIESLKREQIEAVLEDLRGILSGAAIIQSGKKEYEPSGEERILSERKTINELLRLSRGCARLQEYCEANVGTGHITGALIRLISEE